MKDVGVECKNRVAAENDGRVRVRIPAGVKAQGVRAWLLNSARRQLARRQADAFTGWEDGHMGPDKSKRWSRDVTESSDALDLEKNVFTKGDPRSIASSLKRSAEQSRRRKSDPYRSAMSMLTFYINRAGKNLPKSQLERLESAKDELRDLFGRKRTGSR
jgi:hypothetical protein